MRLRVLFNPAAGRGRARRKIATALRRMHERGAKIEFLQSRSAEHLVQLASETRPGDCDRLVVCGGDGTVNLTIRQLNLRDIPVAIVPLGSGDDFAQHVGIPRDTLEAADLVLDGEERLVDVALVNGIRYLGVAGLGFDSEVAARANTVRRLRGSLVYLYAIMRVLPAFKPHAVKVCMNGTCEDEQIMFAVVGNTPRYGAGIHVVPGAIVDDGQLDLCLVRECTRWDLLTTLPRAYSGGHVTRKFVITKRAPEFSFESARPLDVYADGEYLTTTPALMKLAPEQLRVIVPRGE
jgi:diacylglycerol kinase (ATP)